MSETQETIAKAVNIQDAKAEGELRRAAVDALKRNGLPEDLIERTRTLPGTLYEHAAALPGLPGGDRATLRKAFKDFAGFLVGEFDRLTATAGESGDGRQGRPVEWNDPDPWPEPVDGAALLREIADFITRYVSLPAELADTATLWVPVTWIHDSLDISPFLNLTSATKRCGKSLLLEVLGEFAYRALAVGGRVTSAPLFRLIEAHAPTLLLDEADTYLRDDDELRGVVNGSQRRSSAYVFRCVGDDHEPRRFGTWCPKAIAGIGGLPETVLDRSIVLRLERRPPNVELASWRDRDKGAVETLCRKLARWIGDNKASIVAGLSAVEFPSTLHDRARDAWEAPLAIGNAAGGEWAGRGGRAWRACEGVVASPAGDETGAGETLLADLRDIFEAAGRPAALASKAILDNLNAMEGRPWAEWARGKPLSAHGLSKLLKPFNVQPRQVRLQDGGNLKGYRLADLEPLFTAYLTDRTITPGADPKHRNNPLKPAAYNDPETKHGDGAEGAVSDLDRSNSFETKDCFDVSDLQSPSRGNGAESAPAPVSRPSQPPGTDRTADAYRKASRGD